MKHRMKLAWVFLFFLFVSGVPFIGWATDIPVINVDELKTKMDAGEKVYLLNPLADIIYNEGYIPGSVNIPMHQIADTDKLPKEKDTLIVSYCLGPK